MEQVKTLTDKEQTATENQDGVIKMKKTKSWVTENPQFELKDVKEEEPLTDEDKEQIFKMAAVNAEVTKAIIGTYSEITECKILLSQILTEMKKANGEGINMIANISDPSLHPTPLVVPSVPKIVNPASVSKEDAVINYYKDQFRTIKDYQGNKISEENIAKAKFLFDKESILVQMYISGTKGLFAATVSFIENSLHGKYDKDKKGFVMPYPTL